MSTSAINLFSHNNKAKRTGIVYLVLSALCILINRVYALFGHGISSVAMSFMFLYPLLGGALPFLLLWLLGAKVDHLAYYRFFYNCYNSGIAMLTVSGMLTGILQIAGTSSPFIVFFIVLGWVMVALGIITLLANLSLRKKQQTPKT